MKIRYHPEASAELDDAYQWYETQQLGLGSKFTLEAEATIHRIINFPNLHSEIYRNIRRAILPIFPYAIYYSVNEGAIDVYAIAHLHRKPHYWTRRFRRKKSI